MTYLVGELVVSKVQKLKTRITCEAGTECSKTFLKQRLIQFNNISGFNEKHSNL